MSPEKKGDRIFDESGPAHLARAILSWVLVAIITLVAVWIVVFAVTRRDAVGWVVFGSLVALGVIIALFRRSRSP